MCVQRYVASGSTVLRNKLGKDGGGGGGWRRLGYEHMCDGFERLYEIYFNRFLFRCWCVVDWVE